LNILSIYRVGKKKVNTPRFEGIEENIEATGIAKIVLELN
jgi:hypothetical protein